MSANAWFVAGTDTGIGKTHISCALLRAAAARGLRSVGMKPVAAGAQWLDGRWLNEDTARLMDASNHTAAETLVTPYCLRTPVSPHLAAADEGVEIDFALVRESLEQLRAEADCVVVEGAGGLLVPLGPQRDFADLALALELPVILVVGMRLGCLNHARLTVEALQARGLHLAGWVANRIDPQMQRFEDNLASLQACIDAPLLGVAPHGDEETAAKALSLPFERPSQPTLR